jgi:hypothetical protein
VTTTIGRAYVVDDNLGPQAMVMTTPDLSILESLGLVRHVGMSLDHLFQTEGKARIELYYYHLTEMGIRFCNVCSAPMISKLREKEDSSRRK